MADVLSEWCEGVLPSCPTRFNAAEYCIGPAAMRPSDKLALLAVAPETDTVREWSFGDLSEAVRRIAGALQRVGLGKGDPVVILLGDVPEFPLAYFGVIAAGGIATPLSSQLSDFEISAILQSVAPKVVLGGTDALVTDAARLDFHALLSADPVDFAATEAEDPALLVFTSGSSGQPKGVLHAQRAFWARQSMHAGWHGIGPGDRVMHAGAFNWTFTLGVGLADTWSVGGTAIVNSGARDATAWPLLARRHEPTVFAAAPGVYRQILKYGQDLGTAFATLDRAVTAGEKLSKAIAEQWKTETGKPLLEALGMSEVSTYISTPPNRSVQAEQAGWAQPGRRIAVLGDDDKPVPRGQVGRLAVHADDPGLMLGYWKRPDLTRMAYCGDWFVTGDLVTMSQDGAVAYAGRHDDQMNAGGYRVDPHDVEAALLRVPGIAECGVAEHAVRDDVRVIAAWLVPDPGATLTRDAVLAGAGKLLAAYKMPRALFLAQALPRTANGKLVRRRLPTISAQDLV